VNVDDLFGAVVGQSVAVERLRAASKQPVHAYLFIGPQGSGRRAAARAFAAAVLATGTPDDIDRHQRLALQGKHPDVFEFSSQGRSLRGEEAEALIVEASRSPIEADRKILIVDRFHTAEPGAAASLLKTVEEPPDTAMFILLSEEVLPEHITIASRCTTIDFGPISETDMTAWLQTKGAPADLAATLTEASKGNLRRATLLLSDPEVANRRALWWSAAEVAGGPGALIAGLIDQITDAIDAAQGPLDDAHSQEIEQVDEQAKRLGLTATARKEITSRHKRESRRLRDEELSFGFATIAARYHGAGDLLATRKTLDLVREATHALIRNPNEKLLLQRLLLELPPIAT